MGTMAERFGKPVSSADTRRRHASARMQQEDRERYIREWAKNMITYWRERLVRLQVMDTNALNASIQAQLLLEGAKAMISHSFLYYGKYVDDGTGREFNNSGYTDVNGRTYKTITDKLGRTIYSSRGKDTFFQGQLPFLLPGGEEYRAQHGLDKPKRVGPAWGGRVAGGHPRIPKPWFFDKYIASKYVLNELEQDYWGRAYQGMLVTAIDYTMDTVKYL